MSKAVQLLVKEGKRQAETIDLIPSENIASRRVQDALASYFTNKYAEGYPGKRYYPGNVMADELELYAQNLARKIFGLTKRWHVNVQPYSGSPANIAVYFGLLNFGDTIMGMALSHGGHLTHGHKVNFSGRAYRTIQYGVGPYTGRIDYDELERLAKKYRPKLIVSGATAYPRKIDFARIGDIAKNVKALHLADISHIAGLVVAKLHPSPFPHADVITTTTHKTLRGPRAAIILCKKEYKDAIDKAVFPGLQGGPHLNTIAAIAVAFEEAIRPSFRHYQQQVLKNAKTLARELIKEGFQLLSDGTDNHLLLANVKASGIDASWAEGVLEQAGILANRNTVPGDASPFRPSGIRMGTPSVTSRGMREQEMRTIAVCIAQLLRKHKTPLEICGKVKKLCKRFPIPEIYR
ncbi:MAG: serine hydroxymethyltransferase [Candidatus Terrybacteria bacterium RIFCSPHIGHO2_01_FULL_48_17]|uniref:Serine hydroxymethyltransferase n=1 Tax=Candidatus Terrybacteria bacterium RIFCSPHIGHO2_01_FULL_48_17 TaxID=1802362 RepID=A0A1G2PMB1_9BACT|nr:MAG: serine hydroxymethyltransferase [Candidatus Terrybacteria bacterium RIFCSPHIGHO2_01_FULL_48_17]